MLIILELHHNDECYEIKGISHIKNIEKTIQLSLNETKDLFMLFWFPLVRRELFESE